MIHAGSVHLIGILDNDLNVRTSVRPVSGAVSLSDDNLFPAVAPLVGCLEQLRRKTLPPLHVKFFSSSELRRKIIGEVQPEVAGSIRWGLRGNRES
jgi:hypothetical protein